MKKLNIFVYSTNLILTPIFLVSICQILFEVNWVYAGLTLVWGISYWFGQLDGFIEELS